MSWESYRREIINNKKIDNNWYIIGIDLGTTNSVISYYSPQHKKAEPIDTSNGFGKIPMPSVVQYRKEEDMEEEWIIGEEAYRSLKIYPETTITSIKRKMGTDELIKVGSKDYLPEEISAMILKELIQNVENINPKMELIGVVVSVPYDFDDAAKKATIKACNLAGLNSSLICLIEEPKAAALAYNFRHELNKDEKIMVFDFGGGTLDITIFHVNEKDNDKISLRVLSEGGEAYHGGDNIDKLIYNQLVEWIKEKNGDNKLSKENEGELILRARETKERLSGIKKFRIPFTFCIPPFVKEINREEFLRLINPIIEKTKGLVLKTLRDAYIEPLNPESIDRILLEGGSSRMPWVKEMLIEIFNEEDKIYCAERPALDISLGATYYAAMKMGIIEHPEMTTMEREIEFEVPVPHDIGLEIDYGNKKSFFSMINRGTPYPLAKKAQVFTLTGETKEDMTTLELKILERVKKGDKIDDCKLIGKVIIRGLPERPSGKTKIKLTLSVDENSGIVKGTVEDLGFNGIYKPSGFKASFSPNRNEDIIIKG